MNFFVQGMRRSGTTILYDALLEDPDLDCHYEPLREQGVTVGGGSGAREDDAFERTRALRAAFRDRHFPQLDIEEFNWGGPRLPDVELEPDLPEHVRALLRHLLDLAPQTLVKETRLHCKVAELAELDPEAAFVHVVRDPRAVATSIVLGRGRRRLRKIATADDFFAARSERKLWSSRRISELLVERPGYSAAGPDPTDVERVLLVWKLTFAEARRAGMQSFGERYLLLRNEDLRADPAAALAELYRLLGREPPRPVAAWARSNVRPVEEPYLAGDGRWAETLERLGLGQAVADAGYGGLVAGSAR